jgi:glycosyltransferase involved in cell wall biosynthesis
VIPRQNTYFNKCKSNLKFLESSMLEIPVIAQAFDDGLSPYQVDPEDAEHMILCYTQDEFVQAIHDLAKDKDRRREMGRKAKEYVTKKYDINNNSYLWEQAYQNLFRPIQ